MVLLTFLIGIANTAQASIFALKSVTFLKLIIMGRSFYFLLAAILFLAPELHAQQYKLKQSSTLMGMKTASTIYVKGLRKRTEGGAVMGIPVNPTIEQCDLQRTITLNLNKKLYYIEPFSRNQEEVIDEDIRTVPKKTTPVVKSEQKGGTITMYFSIIDTGERKMIFGFNARRIWTSQKIKPSPDACSMKDSITIKTDGWYIDLPEFNCPVRYSSYKPAATTAPAEKSDCQDKFITRRSGKGKLGFPLKVTTTLIMGDGSGKTTELVTDLETVELTNGKLDSMLFEIPPGFTEAKSMEELQEKADYRSMIKDLGKQVKDKAGNQEGQIEADKGKILIGVLVPFGDESLNEYGADLQQYMVRQLNNSRYAAIGVKDAEEAKAKKCTYSLATEFIKLKQASKVGGLLKAMKNADPGAVSSFNIDLSLLLNDLSDGSLKQSEKVSGKFEGKMEESAKRSLEEGCSKLLNDISR